MPETDLLTKLLLGVERDIHRDGWDQPPFLGVLVRKTNKLSLLRTGLPLGPNPGVYLAVLGKAHLEQPHLAQLLATDYDTPEAFYGVAMCNEAWMREENDEQAEARRKAKKMMADLPGSHEIRTVSAVTIEGQVAMVIRKRGEKPTVDYTRIGGRMIEGMADMVYAVARLMPGRPENLAALSELRDWLKSEKPATRS